MFDSRYYNIQEVPEQNIPDISCAFRLLDCTRQALLVLDSDNRMLYCNKTSDGLLQKCRGEMLGRILNAAFSKDRHAIFAERILFGVRHPPEQGFTILFDGDNDTGCFEVNIHPVPEGIALFILATTEQRKVPSELAASERRLQELVDNLP